jgi:hypothetical protein
VRAGRFAKKSVRGYTNFFKEMQWSNWLENLIAIGSFWLNEELVTQMTARAICVIGRIGMLPVANDAGGKNQ